MIKISDSACKFLLSTVDDVFDMTSIHLNQLKLIKTWFHVDDLRKDLFEVLGMQAETKGLQLTFKVL